VAFIVSTIRTQMFPVRGGPLCEAGVSPLYAIVSHPVRFYIKGPFVYAAEALGGKVPFFQKLPDLA